MSEYYKKLPAVCDLYQPISIDEIMIAEGRCWLPIGEKKEFEEGTLFGKVSRGGKRMLCLSLDFKLDSVLTHYLSPPPIVSRGCVSCPTHNDVCFSKNALIESQLKELEAKDKRISELEESLRKEREANQWKKLSEFEGEWIDQTMVLVKIGMNLDGKSPYDYELMPHESSYNKSYAIAKGYTHYYIVPEFKPDNSARIAESECREQEAIEEIDKKDPVLGAVLKSISSKVAELAKLKGEK